MKRFLLAPALLSLALLCPAAQASGAAPELTYRLTGAGLSGPARVAGGYVWVTFRNTQNGLHTAQVLELASGSPLDGAVDELNAVLTGGLKGAPRYIRAGLGGPAPTARGEGHSAGMQLRPGLYLVWSGALAGTERVRRADARLLRVEGQSGAAVPRPASRVRMAGLRFTFSGPLRAGRQLVHVENAAPMPHWMAVMALKPGKTFAQARAQELQGINLFDRGGWYGPMQGTFVIDGAYSNDVWLDLRPGEYMVICYVMDHQRAGMLYRLVVTR